MDLAYAYQNDDESYGYQNDLRLPNETLEIAIELNLEGDSVKELKSAIEEQGALQDEVDSYNSHADVPVEKIKSLDEATKYIVVAQNAVEEEIRDRLEENIPGEYDPWYEDNLTEDGVLRKD
jgi:hypothetical protein